MFQAVKELPEGMKLAPFAESEMRRLLEVERKIYIRRSERMWAMVDEHNHTLLVVGIIKPTQISIPELWLLMCEPFSDNLRTNWPEIKNGMNDLLALYPQVMVRVDAQLPAGKKFVERLGFMEYHREVRGDREYIYYKVSNGIRNSGRA